jgi:pyruvate dehydrogenase E1 component beta subunit
MPSTATQSTETITYKQAITRGLADALEADESVFLFGEDVGAAGGAFKVTEGLYERFGPRRVRDTPISEQAIIGTAIGAAIQGLRPVAEIMFADFAGVCFDGIANELPKYRYMTGGQVTLPVTIRLGNGAGAGFGAQHSQPVENWFLNVPGLKIVVPATPADAYGLLRAAIEDPDPVLYFEHKHLFNLKGELPQPGPVAQIGKAEVVRAGTQVTVIATQLMVHRSLQAAEQLAGEDVDVEVIDMRTLAPLDLDTVAESIDRTNRLVVAQEASNDGSWGATVIARLVADRFESLDAPPLMVGGDDTPIPYSSALESLWLPSAERIADGVRATLAY